MRYIALIICCSMFISRGRKEPATVSFPVDKQFVLDSTVIGTSTIASGLDVPWEITWGSDNYIWMTEQGGTVSKLNPKTGEIKIVLRLPDVYRKRTMGLLGMAVSRDLKTEPYVFLDYTFLDSNNILSRLVRYTYRNDTLIDPLVLLNDIPGANGHNGSRITIAPDGKLMMSTGDAQVFANAQDKASVSGKVLRINADGTIPSDNPFPGNPVWSLGHRNIQGLAYGINGILYSSEHGDAIEDEINIIQKGGNYGWPNVEGLVDRDEEKRFVKTTPVTAPIRSWTPTIAPAGIEFYNSSAIPEWKNSLLLTTLKGSSLYVLKLDRNGRRIVSEKIYLNQFYGRIRDICVSPTGEIYLSTSNRDWNPSEGFPKPNDDCIVRITRIKTDKNAARKTKASETNTPAPTVSRGNLIYTNYCASCHKSGGEGVPGNFPPLKENAVVTGDKKPLIAIVLEGMSGPLEVKGVAYNQAMPAFKFLTDKDVAAVLTYVRTSFNNKAGAVTIGEVSKSRKAKKS